MQVLPGARWRRLRKDDKGVSFVAALSRSLSADSRPALSTSRKPMSTSLSEAARLRFLREHVGDDGSKYCLNSGHAALASRAQEAATLESRGGSHAIQKSNLAVLPIFRKYGLEFLGPPLGKR